MPERHPDHDLLAELEPVAEQLLDRHLAMANEWLPPQYVSWSRGHDFDTEPWTPDQPRLTGVAQAAFEVNLLTEDNLPSYHHQAAACLRPRPGLEDLVAPLDRRGGPPRGRAPRS